MYQLTRGQLLDLKDEIKHLLKRMVKLYGKENIRVLMLQDYPLINMYKMMMELVECEKKDAAKIKVVQMLQRQKLCNFLMIRLNFNGID